jgi:hypothetical protein
MSAEREREPAPPPRAERYPSWVISEDERRRWDLCVAVCEQAFGYAPGSSAAEVRLAAGALYRSEIPT